MNLDQIVDLAITQGKYKQEKGYKTLTIKANSEYKKQFIEYIENKVQQKVNKLPNIEYKGNFKHFKTIDGIFLNIEEDNTIQNYQIVD